MTLGDEVEKRAVVMVETSYEYDDYTTENTTKYYINFTTNEDVPLKNGDFENNGIGWTRNNNNGDIVYEGIDGGKCLKITNKNNTYTRMEQKIQLESDINYVLSGYVKSDGTFNDNGASIDVDENFAYAYDYEDNFLRGSNDWTYVRVYFTTSYTGETTICCRVGHYWRDSIGTGYFDNINIEKLEYPGDETVGRVLYETDNMVLALSKGLVNVVGMDVYKGFSEMMQECYEAEAELIGATPFNGAKIFFVNDDVPLINNYGGIGNFNPVKVSYDQLSSMESWASGKGGGFSWVHELGHVFDKKHNNNVVGHSYVLNIGEFWTNTQMLYVLDAVDSFRVEMGSKKLTYNTADEIAEYYKSDAGGGYDNLIKKGVYSDYYHDALTYIFIQIKDVVGWEPFKTTYRSFVNDESGLEYNTDGNILDKFLYLVQENYNPGGTEVMDVIGKDVYTMILNGMNYTPAYGLGDKNVEYSVINNNSNVFDQTVRNGKLAGENGTYNIVRGIKINLEGTDSIYYRGYVDGEWTEWLKDNEPLLAGEKGTIQAIQIKLPRELEKDYDVVYRATNKYHGYLGWTSNGKTAGDMASTGVIEGFQVLVVSKNKDYKNYFNKNNIPACKNEIKEDGYVYFKNTNNWSEPYVYMWNSSTDTIGAWPGVKMEYVGNGIYRYEVDATMNYTGIIFNNGTGIQTNDLTYMGSNYMYTRNTGNWTKFN